ncbi:MAG: hypothetical protein HY292_06645 [Planctomycetes bacterium]|nr:hypothetical protein [Planctomycetota bacterium]
MDRLSSDLATSRAREAAAVARTLASGDRRDLDEAREAVRHLFEDPERYGRLVRAIDDAPDPVTRRRAERLQVAFVGTSPRPDSAKALRATEAACVEALSRVTPLESARTARDGATRESDYRARSEASRSYAPPMRALLVARNRAARDTLFRDAWEAHCFAVELDPADVQALLDGLEARTRAAYADWTRERCAERGIARLEAWDVFESGSPQAADRDAAFPAAASVERAKRLFQEIGLGDAVARVKLFPQLRDGRGRNPDVISGTPGGVTLALDPASGPDGFADLVAGFAAAVHEGAAPPGPTETARPVRLFRDGIGRAVAWVALDESFLRASIGLDEGVIGRIADERSRTGVANVRRRLLAAAFEREASRSPGRDLDELWRNLCERYLDVAPHPGLEPWPELVPTATDPFGALDGVLEEAIAAQVVAALPRETRVTPATGDWLRDHVYALGASEPWPRILERATGSPFTPIPLLRRLLGRAAGD